jgi:tRNA A-37 threonylcarbamoyl transferase component Bud32
MTSRIAGSLAPMAMRSGRVKGTTLVATPALFEAFATRLQRHATLYAWAAAQPQPRTLRGRGVVYVAELDERATAVAVRHAWHGGLLAPLTGDRFLLPTRAPREAAVSRALAARGIETPEVLAYALYPAGPALRRVDVCTRYVPNGWDFGAVLDGVAEGVERSAADRAAVALLARLAHTGVVHPDLNVKNILLAPRDGDGPAAWLLDVDIVTFDDGPPHAIMQRNLARLARSIRTWHRRHAMPLDTAWLARFTTSCLEALP